MTLPNGVPSDGEYPPENPSADDSVPFGAQDGAQAVSQTERRAIWLSYLELQNLLTVDQAATQKNLERVFDNVADMGLDTVIVQVRPFADAIYKSSYFPWSHIITGTQGQDPGYDPLAIMTKLAKDKGLRIEAWVNPYRVKSTSTPLSQDSALYGWLTGKEDLVITADGQSGAEVLSQALYLNPAKEEARTLIVNGAKELAKNYEIDAIHFDDYFYPTTDAAFDKAAYAASGSELSLDAWRRENVSKLVQEVYKAVKSVNPKVEFGISPQGNMDVNFNKQYADVKTWVKNEGYLDYIMPQVYYGFKNNLAFDKTAEAWANLTKDSSVKLYLGLAAYKIGKEDQWAGDAGKQEWVTDSGDLLKRQIEFARSLEGNTYKGFSLYSYNSLFQPEAAVKEQVAEEMKNLKTILK
ncbi:glycoside hydrolase family 10 protein [Zongyangia hominis]|uniref:Family 10 glycosylhydrolase n=1 Tax=Zongyangia hominis TaxID=2763677 RepID=A0A926ED25_9FIRM|nr:family 10 glycosylhydrolase [Zongyangia hominis]MBC8569532.1 family 10 glycosylhydrolase [Zongyangia hominis]